MLRVPVLLVLAVTLISPVVATAQPAIDAAWTHAELWDDGQAEIAFYQIERTRDRYGNARAESFPAGTYLVKHGFDVAAQSKGSGGDAVSAFKWALFYEFESRSYQYKRAWVTNAARADLSPLKASLTVFDWCSNTYRELAFHEGGQVDSLMRSDDYGNAEHRFAGRAGAYPVSELPLLMRGLDFSHSDRHELLVVLDDGGFVPARARLLGRETVTTDAGDFEAEKIELSYEAEVPSLIGEQADAVEHYWRGTGPARLLLKLEAESGRYRMTLLEHLRSAYWRENFYPRLERVEVRP